MDDSRFYTATAETKLQHAELFRASVGAPANPPVALIVFFCCLQRRSGAHRNMRKEAAKRDLDPDKWFNNEEIVTAEKVGIERQPTCATSSSNYTAYKLMLDLEETQKKAREVVKRPG
jgi:hypothetical protein